MVLLKDVEICPPSFPASDETIAFSLTPPKKLFSELELGDTAANPENSYVAEITHFLITENKVSYVVNKNNLKEAIKRRKERHGPRAKLYIASLGVKLYKGFERQKDGSLKPINPWFPPGTTQEVVVFFSQYDCIPLEQIVRFESCRPGDLILFSKTNGFVVAKKKLNKPRFYSTSSWTGYAITLLSNQAFARFLPNRKFTVSTGCG